MSLVLGRPGRRRRRPAGDRRGHAAAALLASTASSRSATTTATEASSRSRSLGDAATRTEVERGRMSRRVPRTPRATSRTCPRTSPRRAFLAERAAEIAGEHESLEVEVLDRDAIVARGMGALRRGGAGQRRRAAADRAALPAAGRRRAAPGLRGQGRDLRHRRDLDQARGEDAGDEVRHVGRRRRASRRWARSPRSACRSP